jgi:hypothetical protein
VVLIGDDQYRCASLEKGYSRRTTPGVLRVGVFGTGTIAKLQRRQPAVKLTSLVYNKMEVRVWYLKEEMG